VTFNPTSDYDRFAAKQPHCGANPGLGPVGSPHQRLQPDRPRGRGNSPSFFLCSRTKRHHPPGQPATPAGMAGGYFPLVDEGWRGRPGRSPARVLRQRWSRADLPKKFGRPPCCPGGSGAVQAAQCGHPGATRRQSCSAISAHSHSRSGDTTGTGGTDGAASVFAPQATAAHTAASTS